MNLKYKRATLEDIDILTETRIEVLRAANKLSADTDMSEVERRSYNYYQKALCDGSHIAYLIFDENRFVGAGGVSFFSSNADLPQSKWKQGLYYEKYGFVKMIDEMELPE